MISKKVFCDAVKAIVGQLKQNKIAEVHLEALTDSHITLKAMPAVNGLIELLEIITQDKCEWLAYWLFELQQGEKYRPGSVAIDGKIVKLETVGDLYRVLKAGFGK